MKLRFMVVVLSVGCEGVIPETPTYTVDVRPILDQHCVRCHHDEGRLEDGVGLSSYSSARSTRIRLACTALDSDMVSTHAAVLRSQSDPAGSASCVRWEVGSMPPGAINHLSLYQQEILARWIATGAAE